MPERDFWRTMNPARLHTLFTAWFRPERRALSLPQEAPKEKPSLFSYLTTGGE